MCCISHARATAPRSPRLTSLPWLSPLGFLLAPRGSHLVGRVAARGAIEHLLHPLQALRRSRVRFSQSDSRPLALTPHNSLRVNQSVKARFAQAFECPLR